MSDEIINSIYAGETPSWYSSLPDNLQSFLLSIPVTKAIITHSSTSTTTHATPKYGLISGPISGKTTVLVPLVLSDIPNNGTSDPIDNYLSQLIRSSTSSTSSSSSFIFSDEARTITSDRVHAVLLSGGAIGGIVVGVVAVLIMAATSSAWLLLQRRKRLANLASHKLERSSDPTTTPQIRPSEMLDSNDIVEIDSTERMPESDGTRHFPPEMLAPGGEGEELRNTAARSELDGIGLSVRHEMKA